MSFRFDSSRDPVRATEAAQPRGSMLVFAGSRASFRPSFSWSWRRRRIRASRSSSFRQEGGRCLRSSVAAMTLSCVVCLFVSQRDQLRAAILRVGPIAITVFLHDGQSAADRSLAKPMTWQMREAGMPGSIGKQRHDPPFGGVDAEIASLKHCCAVRELVRDERYERRNAAFEVERRTVMPGFLPGLGRASCHVSDQGSRSSKQT